MFRRVLLAVLCLIPSVAFAGDHDPAEVDFGPGLYWRYLVAWHDDAEGEISYRIEGFRDSGVFTEGGFLYQYPCEGCTLPPPMELFASNFDNVPKLDTDGDFDLDVNDLNFVRNEFGQASAKDLDGDGVIGVGDLNKVRNEFGFEFFDIKPQPWEPNIPDDWFWFSGEVLDDCVVLLDARVNSPAVVPCAAASPVPEPSTFAIAVIAIMALSRRIWSRCRQS